MIAVAVEWHYLVDVGTGIVRGSFASSAVGRLSWPVLAGIGIAGVMRPASSGIDSSVRCWIGSGFGLDFERCR